MVSVVAQRWFHWLPVGSIPAGIDLRRAGWELRGSLAAPAAGESGICLACPERFSTAEWFALVAAPPDRRRMTLLCGIDDTADRERMLRLGFGDAVGAEVAIGELALRAAKVAEQATSVPRYRTVGPLRLDLAIRDARIAGRRLGLHPREFALLWRLADCPGEAAAPEALLRDVWQLAFKPETNSLAVHVSRLRAKLRIAGAGGLIETTPSGGYRLVPTPERCDTDPLPRHAVDLPLDDYVRLREESRITEQEASHEA